MSQLSALIASVSAFFGALADSIRPAPPPSVLTLHVRWLSPLHSFFAHFLAGFSLFARLRFLPRSPISPFSAGPWRYLYSLFWNCMSHGLTWSGCLFPSCFCRTSIFRRGVFFNSRTFKCVCVCVRVCVSVYVCVSSIHCPSEEKE